MNLLKLIQNEIQEFIFENKYVDDALDRLSQVNGDINQLNELDKLILYAPSKDVNKLKRIDLDKIYKELGGTFGYLMLKVRIKDYNEQPIKNHKFSEQYAGEEGYMYPYINYTDDGKEYVTIKFDKFIANPDYKGGGSYEEARIFLANLYPISYDDTNEEFIRYGNRVELDRKEERDNWDADDEYER